MASAGFSYPGNVSEEERRRYLHILQGETTRMMIPAMIFLILLAVVGLVGNSLVLIVYSRNFQQTSTRIFIIAIAAFDLVTNVLAIPGEIYDMLHRWDFNQPHLCGFRLTLNALTIVTSAFLLVAVAVVRYKKVCRPHGSQTTIRSAKFTSLAIIFAAIVCAVPCAILNGRQTKSTPRDDIKGHACTIDDRYVGTIWPRAYMGTFIVGFLVCCTSLIVLYTLIGIQAWRHSNINRVVSSVRSAPSSTYQTTSEATGFNAERKPLRNITGIRLPFLFGWKRQKDVKTHVRPTDNKNCTCAHEETESTPVTTLADMNLMEKDNKGTDRVEIDCDIEMQSLPVVESSRKTVSSTSLTDKTDQRKPSSNNEIQARDRMYGTDIMIGSGEPFTRGHQTESPDREILESGDKTNNQKNFGDQEVHVTYNDNEPGIRTRSNNREGESEIDVSPSMRDQCRNRECEANEREFREPPPFNDEQDEKLCDGKFKRRKTVDFLLKDTKQKKISDLIFHRKSSKFDDSLKEENHPKHRRPMTRTTIMLIAISAVYVIGFVPHLSLIFFRYSSPRVFGGMTFAGFAVYNLFLRFHFLNSASNAIIYSLCDKKFREHAKRILKCLRR